MDYKKILSYISNIIVFIATAILVFKVVGFDTTGKGITTSEFMPIRNAMFAIGIPCFIKFYISADKEFKEEKIWFLGYIICVVAWASFLFYALTSPYFASIRTMCIASFVLMIIALYLEYSVVKDK